MFRLSDELVNRILAFPEIQNAYTSLISASVVSFTIPVTEELGPVLEALGLPALTQLPLRWIRGDTAPHIDTGAHAFERTQLIYLTDSEGEFVLEDQVYPIRKGCGFVFSEGLRHETRNTGTEPRLLLGPMSETGMAVGGFTNIYGPGGSTIYIRQDSATYQYSDDQVTWNNIFSFPCYVANTDGTPTEVLTIEFITDITLTDINSYFICNSSHIQFGSTSILSPPKGLRPVITIDGVLNYPGFIQNGTSGSSGYSNIYVYNISVSSANGSTLFSQPTPEGGGWIGQSYFAKEAAENYIVNCSSDGIIALYAGGIVGSHAGNGFGASLTLRGCSSYGFIGSAGGGIAGSFAGGTFGAIVCESCWSQGAISLNSGGILGQVAGTNNGNATVINCYSTGFMDFSAGGICGVFCGAFSGNATISNCYSSGTISSSAGGITGSSTGDAGGNAIITNCYSLGNIDTSAGGICGDSSVNTTILNCYTVGAAAGSGYIIGGSSTVPASCYSEALSGIAGTWSSTHANAVLTGAPNPIVGITWIARDTNQPYELRAMGYTPYTLQIINASSELVRSFSQTVQAGQATIASIQADASGNQFVILKTENGDPASYASISMNSQTGVISTTSNTVPGIYLITLRSVGSYNITQFELTITESTGACCGKPLYVSRDVDYAMRNDLLAGNTLIGNTSVRRGPISYTDIMNMKRAYAAKR